MVYPKIKLKAARVNAEMTQEDVAKALNRNKQTIVNWENGVTEIKVNDFKLLSELYEIPIEFSGSTIGKRKSGINESDKSTSHRIWLVLLSCTGKWSRRDFYFDTNNEEDAQNKELKVLCMSIL